MAQRRGADKIDELIRSVPTETLCARLVRARKRHGVSIRELAAAAGVNKNSILRLERGLPPLPSTVRKLCAAMGLHVAALLEAPADGTDEFVVHRRENDRWYDLTDFESGPVAETPLTPAQRKKLLQNGVNATMLMLRNRLEFGSLMPNVLELFGPTERRSHQGEEMVYVLSGRVKVNVGEREVELSEGEAISFWSSEPHSYAPADRSPLPVRILSVTAATARHRGDT